MKSPPHCSTISAQTPFLATLAAQVMATHGHKALILLPNRRACRSLRQAFLAQSSGKPMLLPRIQPLGELDGEDIGFFDEALPPVIPPLRRQLLLTQLVMRFERKYDMAQATELACQLARFLDEVAREGLALEDLSSLVPETLAAHWQETLNFLQILSHHWPRILADEGVLDVVVHRNALLAAVAKRWETSPPDYPIIAAGSTGSQPATARLLSVIARLPQGQVVLQGLDTDMPEEEWETLTETHPQFAFKQLLQVMQCHRGQVSAHPHSATWGNRETVTRALFAPPQTTARWREQILPLTEALENVALLEAESLLDEARMIAITLREALETPGKTAALITPDRTLARMVSAQMQRFSVMLDDSAGRALADTPTGYFLRLSIECVANRTAPANLLALLRHPFAAGGMDAAQCRRLSRALEIESLRGMRPEVLRSKDKSLAAFLDDFSVHAAPLAALFKRKAVSLSELLKAHLVFAEWLALKGALWAGEAGEAIAAFMAELFAEAELLSSMDPASYPALFESLLSAQTYWPRFGQHPRLHILSPMEARMQQFDKVILGSLNEGVWPALPNADPWMSRPMRNKFGLPLPERAIGQSAHDVAMLLVAPEVLLTRARKHGGVPTVPSRWWVRLQTLVEGLDKTAFARLNVSRNYETAKAMLDTPLSMPPLLRPAPTPPLSARPRRLRVTAIDQWLRDPYMIYAQYVLKLRALELLDREPDARDFGTIVHQAMEEFIRGAPTKARLLECGQKAFADRMNRPAVASLWWPRFEAMADWIIAREEERRSAIKNIYGELQSEWTFDVNGHAFTLTTRIDRLEVNHQGKATVIDYKTGTLPAAKDINAGLANQLPLEALIVHEEVLVEASVGALEYWKLAGNSQQCDIYSLEGEIPALLAQARQRLVDLIVRYDDPASAYTAQTNPAYLTRHNDYAHLTRRQEWGEV